MCGTCGTTAAVNKGAVSLSCHFVYSFKSGKTTRKFLTDGHENNVFLGKSALECYKSLKEGLRTHMPSHETVCRWVNAISEWMGRER